MEQEDAVALTLPMEVKLYSANPLVREGIGKLAVMRGPIVYCLEEADNGDLLHLIRLGDTEAADLTAAYEPDTLGGVTVLISPGLKEKTDWAAEGLYAAAKAPESEKISLRWIPCYAWANRNVGEMRVWIRK